MDGVMRKTTCATAVAMLTLLAGCSTPAVTGASADSVTLRYDDLLYSAEEIQARAAEYCQSQGHASARFVSRSRDAPLGHRYDVFACE